MRRRVVSALLTAPFFVLFLWFGGIPLTLLTAALMLLALREFERLFARGQIYFAWWLAAFCGLALLFLASVPGGALDLLPAIMATVLLTLILPVVWPQADPAMSAATLLGSLYIALPLSFLLLLRQAQHGKVLVLWVLITIWMADAAAYFVGRSLGRHLLLPHISPKKTVEGAVAGLIGAMLSGYLGAKLGFLPLSLGVGFGAVIAVAGILGDFAESALKRWAGVKDSGRLLPGHGGFLDRFDSVLFVLPAVYYYLKMVMRL